MVVGFPAGGVVDVTARALAEGLRGPLGGAVIVDNRAGAGGRLAIEAVKGAAADGLTLLYSPPSMFTVYPHIDSGLRYDVFTDFSPVSTVCSFPFAIAVAPNLPVKTLPEFLAWAKANPREAAYGSPGTGTIQSFIGAMLAKAAGAPMTHVPYKGGAQSINDVMAGTIASSVSVAQLFTAGHRAGRLRVLAVSGSQRLASLPDVPTFAELGYPSLTFEEWFGVFVPARTPAATVDRLARAIADAIASPAVGDTLKKLDYAPFVVGPAAFADLLRMEHARWGEIVRDTGFKPS
jgi:tripartite-type tricarboxylate transporter receptor subunit TctC